MATTSATSSSGIDVASIVSQLMTAEQQPLVLLSQKEASYQAKLSAYGSVKGALGSFQTAVSALSDISKFQSLSAGISDSSVAAVSTAATAVAGAYTLDVTQLAQAQKLVAAGQVSQTAAIGGAGPTTLTFDFGTITGNTFNATTGKYGTALSGATTTNGITNVMVASTANLAVGAAISGTGIPAGATIASITDATHFVLSAAATADGSPGDIRAGATFTSNGNGIKTVTINGTNNSLQGIRDAINSAKIGVTATIVNDGSASPYRLALSSDNIGKTNSIKISTNVASGGDAAVDGLLANDPAATQNLVETATAQNAEFKVNGIAVSKASNTVSDVIQGVTLNLLKTTTTPASITVANNTSTVGASVTAFVKAYNDLNSTLKSVSAYDPATKTGATLQGDATVLTMQAQLRAALNNPISGGGSLTTLSQVGVSFQKDGTLAVDSAKLNTAISNNFSDIASLFATVGKASDSLVAYSSATINTKPGSYAVHVTSLASQGNATGSGVNLNTVNTTGLTAIAANTTMNVTLDGNSASVALAAGNYTATALAAMVQSAINGTSVFSSVGSSVAATIDGSGNLSITSNRYGSASNVSLASSGAGTQVSAFMGAATTAPGADIIGTIDGVAATGSGQFLTAATGNATGLKIQINGGAIGADRGTVNYSQGYAYTLNQLSTALLASDGPLGGATNGLNSSITDIGKQRDAENVRLAALQKQYTAQFTALDVSLSSMNQTSTYLTQQLANLPKGY